MKRLYFVVLVLIIALISCSKDYENPFDPDVNINSLTEVEVENIGNHQFQLNWKCSYADETGFRIDRKVNDENWVENFAEISTDSFQWIDNNVPEYQRIKYRIAVHFDDNYSDFVESDDLIYISEPQNFEVTQEDVHKFLLSWWDVADGEDGYKIERKIDSGDYQLIHITNANDSLYIDNINSRGFDVVSYKLCSFKDDAQSVYLYDFEQINFPKPTNLLVEKVGNNELLISWEDNSDGEDGFKIDRKMGENDWVSSYGIIAANSTSWADVDVAVGSNVQYRLSAFSGDNSSSNSLSAVFYNNLIEPNSLNFEIIDSATMVLSWDYFYGDILGFKIDKKNNDEEWVIAVGAVNADEMQWTDEDFNLFSDVTYRVYSHTDSFDGLSSEISFEQDNNLNEIDGGVFEMGDSFGNGEWDEAPLHNVEISSFYMSKYEVTFEEFDAYCVSSQIAHPSDSGWGRGERPVINVSWLEAVKYCNWLSAANGMQNYYTIENDEVQINQDVLGYALPTEAEWEFAARGGNLSNGFIYSGSDTADEVGIIDVELSEITGTKTENEVGLFDMSGNVWEWCYDYYDYEYYQFCADAGTVNNPTGPEDGSTKVFRGGCWLNDAPQSRVSNRQGIAVDYFSNTVGFRVVLKNVTN